MGRIGKRSAAAICAAFLLLAACHTPEKTAALTAAGVTLIGGALPSQELEQIYYVGIFDPLEQLPQAVYRLTVRGQASMLSSMKFASGWVPAPLIDGLDSRIGFTADGHLSITPAKGADETDVGVGRRLMLFGPEGFQEAPRDYRLVIVMSSSPEAFFNAVGESLEAVVNVQREADDSVASTRILQELLRLKQEQIDLQRLEARLGNKTASPGGAP